MRKILLSILVCVLLVMTGFFIAQGASFLKVEGFIGLSDENDSVENKIAELSEIVTNKYQSKLANLETATDALMESKTEYETQAVLANSNDSNYTSEMYPVEYLWTKLGNFANDEGIDMNISVYATNVNHLYDLKFVVDGAYQAITNFIYDIENDSSLGFKIDDFQMTSLGENTVRATFDCKGIYINLGSVDDPSTPATAEGTGANNTTTDAKQGTNTTGSAGSTNTTNTAGISNTNTTNSTATPNANTTNETGHTSSASPKATNTSGAKATAKDSGDGVDVDNAIDEMLGN